MADNISAKSKASNFVWYDSPASRGDQGENAKIWKTTMPKLSEIVFGPPAPESVQLGEKDLERIRDVLAYLVYSVGHHYLTAWRLMKLFYLAELKAIERLEHRLTAATFYRWKYGPWSAEVALVADGIPHEDIRIERGETPEGHEARFYRPARIRTIVGLETEEIEAIKEVLDDWRYRKTRELVEACKDTVPFQEALPDDSIDLEGYLNYLRELTPEARRRIDEVLIAVKEGRSRPIRTRAELHRYLDAL